MPAAAVLAPLALTIVFALSGVAKLRHPGSTQSVTRLLRLPRFIQHRWFAIALPVGELILAAMLLVPVHVVFVLAAGAALILCLAYWVVVARAMTFSPRPSCGCFGRIGDQRITGRTLVRNTLLVAVAAIAGAMALSGETVISALDGEALWWILGACAAVALALLIGAQPAGAPGGPVVPGVLTGTVRSEHTPALTVPGRTPEATVPEAAPAVEFDDRAAVPIPPSTVQRPDGSVTSLYELAMAKPQLLIGVDCACPATTAAAERFAGWSDSLPEVDVQVLTPLPTAITSSVISVPFGRDPLYDHQRLSWRRLGMESSPAAVLLGADGAVLTKPISGVEEIDLLVADIRRGLDDQVRARS